jgi:hypothetical protein
MKINGHELCKDSEKALYIGILMMNAKAEALIKQGGFHAEIGHEIKSCVSKLNETLVRPPKEASCA